MFGLWVVVVVVGVRLKSCCLYVRARVKSIMMGFVDDDDDDDSIAGVDATMHLLLFTIVQ